MPFVSPLRDHLSIAVTTAKWLLLSASVGGLVGSACALFLWSLDLVTQVRFAQPQLVWCLPLAGAAVAWIYGRFGKSVESGNNLIVDEIHNPGGGVPLRMAPLVLVGTLLTHLFGGSAGREGTAVQMGGSLANELARWIPGLSAQDLQILLMAGVAAGFGGVFGTPVAGMIFAMEVLVIGRMHYAAILPCLCSSIVSDQTCMAWGIRHTQYHVASSLPLHSAHQLAAIEPSLMGYCVLAGIACGLASLLFAEMTHGCHEAFKRAIPNPILRTTLGGCLVLLLMWLVGTRDYLGLGVTSPVNGAVTIESAFRANGAGTWSWLWKSVFTSVTLASGFKGGEVTPLFYIGACLGNTLASLFQQRPDLFAALGFVSVFAGATNTPIACTMMGIELFGAEYSTYFAVSCTMAYLFSGHSGIYLSQRIGSSKVRFPVMPNESTLRDVRNSRGNR